MGIASFSGASSVIKPGVVTSSTRPSSPFVGQLIYDTTISQTLAWNGSAWIGAAGKVGQVVSTTKTDTYTMSSQTYTTVTGLTATITPSATTSKVLVIASLSAAGNPGVSRSTSRFIRDSTPIAVADTAGSRIVGTTPIPLMSGAEVSSQILLFLDSPASTSALVYGVQVRCNDAAATTYVNRSPIDDNNASYSRAVSTITVMEILA